MATFLQHGSNLIPAPSSQPSTGHKDETRQRKISSRSISKVRSILRKSTKNRILSATVQFICAGGESSRGWRRMFNGECKLASIWLFSKNTKKAEAFYRDLLQMRQIEHGETSSFDGGGLRLSIHPLRKNVDRVPTDECFLVFYVKSGLEEKYEQLKKRGVVFTEGIMDEPFGKTARLRDPDGHDIYLWQPPSRSSGKFKNVSGIVEHYESILSRLEEQH
jgi:predicted enzyme related to lactoylglutathione lyase